MRKTEQYNNGVNTKDLQLEKGEKKIFRGLRIKRDPDYPDRMKMPACVIIPKKDIINIKGVPTEIACVNRVGAKGKVTFHDLNLTKEAGGCITLIGGTIAHQQKYEYLMLSNFRKNNPERDTDFPALYELVDPEAMSKTRRASRSLRLKAMDYADGMSEDEVFTFAGANGWKTTDSIAMLRDQVENYAETNPDVFLKVASNRHNIIKADIQSALDNGILVWDKVKSQFTWRTNGQLITSVPRSSKGTEIDGMLSFIINTEHGESVYTELKTLIGDVVSAKDNLKDAKTVNPNPKSIGKDIKDSKQK